MPNDQLVEYIRTERGNGLTQEQITSALAGVGWPQEEIDKAFAAVEKGASVLAVPEVKTSPVTSNPVVLETPAQTPLQTAPLGRRWFKKPLFLMSVVVLLLILGGVAYVYVEKIAFFSRPPYSEENLVSGILTKMATIQSSSYIFSASVGTEPLTEGAIPFSIEYADEEERAARYARDVERANDARFILAMLADGMFPGSLETVVLNPPPADQTVDFLDPSTGTTYPYILSEDRKDFLLSFTFETPEAVSAIRSSYGFSATSTTVTGRTVTFTKGSSGYFYFPSVPPKPFFLMAQEAIASLPSEFSGSLSAGAAGDWQQEEDSEWKFNLNIEGTSTDLSYRFNVEALKKDGVYYGRINNIPDLLGMFSLYKGKWIKIDPSEKSADSYDVFSMVASGIPAAEEQYKERRKEMMTLLRKAALIADEEGVIAFKSPPTSERVDGRRLYRYELSLRKDATLSFTKRLVEEMEKVSFYLPGIDQSLVEYLESSEFDQVFSYYEQNISQTLWVDSEGYPVITEYAIRIVPPITAPALAGKQARLILRVEYADINKPVDIQAPEEAQTITELLEIGPAMELQNLPQEETGAATTSLTYPPL